MSGEWSINSPAPIRPGFYISFQTTGSPGVVGGQFGVVGMPIVSAWGPINEFVTVRSVDELNAAFGTDIGNADTTAYLVREALIGGAAEVKVLRLTDGTDAKATVTINDTTPTTPKTLTITAKYSGVRADNFKIAVRENPLTNTKNDLIVYEGNIKREVFTHTKTDITGLVAAINDPARGSKLITIVKNGTGHLALAVNSAGTALAGGNNGGTTLLAADYLDAQDAFEREGGFDVYAMDGVDNSAIVANVVQWTSDMNAQGNYLMSVIGGVAGELYSDSITRTLAYDSEFIVSLGGGDHELTLVDGTTGTRSSAFLAPRVAGMIAAAGIKGSITRGVLPGIKPVTPLTQGEAEALINAGVVGLYKRGSDTVIEDGITSFTSFTDEKDVTFGTISNVRVMQQMGVDLNRIFENEFLGKLRNTAAARNAIKTRVAGYLKLLEGQDVLINGSTVELDTRFVNDQYSVYLTVAIRFGLELKKILVGVRAPAQV